MLTIRVVSFKGQPIGGPAAQFGEAGGTIGRGRNSTLVLQDPELFISRTHATISYQAGGYVITDSATKNPVILNGQPLGPGAQARLGDRNQIQIGDYVLETSLAAAAPAPAAAAPPRMGGAPPWPGQAKDDPLAMFQDARGRGPDPFADLVPKPKDDPLAMFGGPRAQGGDPFADLSPKPPMPPDPLIPPPHRPGQDPLAGIQGRELSIDDLLDPKRLGGAAPSRPDPGAAWPIGQQDPGPAVVDPIDVMLGIVKPPGRPTVSDHGPEVGTPFAPPAARPDPAFAPPAPIPSPFRQPPGGPGAPPVPPPAPFAAPPAAPAAPPAQFVPAPPAPAAPRFVPTPPAEGLAPAPPYPVSSGAAPTEAFVGAMPSAPPAGPAPVAAAGAASANEAALLRALLQGAGLAESPLLKTLTPETMETIGALLREAVQGTLDLLRARGLMKSEMRADVTMIMPVENNPLKFSPTVEAALAHLIAPHVQGFLPPVRSMKEAYDDLRAHQLGFLAGMRAALDDVLGRFSPAELEKRLSDPSMLDSLLPMNRRAKQWDLFVQRYGDVASEARENFNAAFGKAFLKAYEAQVKQLRAGNRRA